MECSKLHAPHYCSLETWLLYGTFSSYFPQLRAPSPPPAAAAPAVPRSQVQGLIQMVQRFLRNYQIRDPELRRRAFAPTPPDLDPSLRGRLLTEHARRGGGTDCRAKAGWHRHCVPWAVC